MTNPEQYIIMDIASTDDIEKTNESLKALFPLLDYSGDKDEYRYSMKNRIRDLTGIVDIRPNNTAENKLKCTVLDDTHIKVSCGDFVIKNIYTIVNDEIILDTQNINDYEEPIDIDNMQGHYYVAFKYNKDESDDIQICLVKAIENEKYIYKIYREEEKCLNGNFSYWDDKNNPSYWNINNSTSNDILEYAITEKTQESHSETDKYSLKIKIKGENSSSDISQTIDTSDLRQLYYPIHIKHHETSFPIGWIPISDIYELHKIGNDISYPTDGNYYLTNDIDASVTETWYNGQGWIPIGIDNDVHDRIDAGLDPTGSVFSGIFDGNGYEIKNLYINNRQEIYLAGLFMGLDGAYVKNLGVNANIQTSIIAGILAAGIVGTSLVENCYTTGYVKGKILTGGLSGNTPQDPGNDPTIRNCYSTATVVVTTATAECGGGLLGAIQRGTVENCYSAGKLYGTHIGGLIGEIEEQNLDQVHISGCYWDIEATGKSRSAGDSTGTTGLTTEEMSLEASYIGWDFDETWTMNEIIPRNSEYNISWWNKLVDKEGKSYITAISEDRCWDNDEKCWKNISKDCMNVPYINVFEIPYFQVWYKNQMIVIPETDMKEIEIHFISKDDDYTILYDDISFLGKTEINRIDYNDYCVLCTIEIDNNSEIINLIEKQESYLDPFNYIPRQTVPDYAGDKIGSVIDGGIINSSGSLVKEWS